MGSLENVLYKEVNGKLKYYLSDFSISKNLEIASEINGFMGESKFLAREVVETDDLDIHSLDLKKADIFSLGMCILDVIVS